ncbi:DnaJ-domain-containing protein [Sporormia fimetaria CBS 119925]|uniref:DnaJ-domain-containing protein n=1 Tax=Sporormia fimetaria CBS 119925 TaxID=1340428 RepID=A0A6A6VEG6_9PLEO|nr:DnaJ-domain-containing protein [Sporormia fimetaria CBS 119925]
MADRYGNSRDYSRRHDYDRAGRRSEREHEYPGIYDRTYADLPGRDYFSSRGSSSRHYNTDCRSPGPDDYTFDDLPGRDYFKTPRGPAYHTREARPSDYSRSSSRSSSRDDNSRSSRRPRDDHYSRDSSRSSTHDDYSRSSRRPREEYSSRSGAGNYSRNWTDGNGTHHFESRTYTNSGGRDKYDFDDLPGDDYFKKGGSSGFRARPSNDSYGAPPRASYDSRSPPPRPQPKRSSVDLYAVLGVSRKASQDDIRKAWKKLAMKYHPDKVAPTKKDDATKKMAEINIAYETLFDEKKRQVYDQTGEVL